MICHALQQSSQVSQILLVIYASVKQKENPSLVMSISISVVGGRTYGPSCSIASQVTVIRTLNNE
jgi:hypothetical protein